MKNLKQRLMAGALSCTMLLGMLPGGAAAEGEIQAPGLGEVSMEWSRDIYNGVALDHITSENEYGLQKSYTVTYNPTATEIRPVLNYGPYVMGGDIMSDMVAQVEADGSKVVFAINGDAYDTSNGVSNGLMIKNGVLISTSNSSGTQAVGFKADGTAIYGRTSLNITATPDGGAPITVLHVNKERKLDTENVYLLTEQFAKTTSSTQPGVEVVLNVTTPGYQGLVVGGQLTATVASVNRVEANVNKNNTPIGTGQIVLSANSGSSRYAALNALSAGQTVTVDVRNNNSDVDWSQAVQALGIFHVLMQDGVLNEGAYENAEIHPRTVLGIKADGSLVLFQCDGRQAGWALGVSFKNIVDYLKSEGCVTIFNFDGGGSSTITATLPGDENSTILNRPSDGNERANCNALLFVATSQPDASRELLHVYPDIKEGYGNKVMVLENGKLGLKVGATDGNYHYQGLGDASLKYATEGGIGSVSKSGVLTAAAGTHEGKITVSTQDGSASGELEVQVVDSLTKLTADRSILSVAPKATTRMSFTAEYNGSPVVLTSEALTFRLSDSSLGAIAADGTFTAADTQGTGELKISYKDYTLTLPVEIGKLPVPLNDFEEDFTEAGWKWRYFNGADGGLGDRGGDARMSINYDERYVKSGDGSLRVDYDFATKPLTGTVTCETGPIDYLYLEGQPKAIGCWIYGDGNGAWVRIQLAPSAYAGDVYVNWVGWRYVENAIPTTASFPYRLVYGVRVLGTASVANGKKGTIYVDGLRAVYDFKNDDTLAPELIPGTGVTPADGAADVVNEPDISISVRDPQVEGQAYTGINTERTKLWINGKVMEHNAIQQEVAADGSVKITFHPGALTALRPGLNKIKYRVEDNAGNKFFKEWSFTVAGYAVNLEETYPIDEKAAAGSTFHYIVNATDYKNFEEFQFELGFDPKYVTLVDAKYDSRLSAAVSEVDDTSGSVRYTLTGMSALQKDKDSPLVDLTFRVGRTAGGQTGIKVKKAAVRQTGEVAGTDLVLDGYDREVALKYTLSWTGSTVGGATTLKLADSVGSPVPGLGFHVTLNDEPVDYKEVTGSDGTVTTSLFGSYPVDTQFQVWVEDGDGALSNTQKITVYDSLGTADPAKMTVTTGEDPATAVGISWETSLGVSEGSLIIGKTADLTGEDTRILPATSRAIDTSMYGYVRNYRSWGVRATELEPDTTYYYRAGYEGHYSPIRSFTTAPADGDLTLAFYGDIQGAYNQFPNAIGALEELYPDIDLNLQAGDVSDNSQAYSDWVSAYSGFGDYLSNRIWAPTIGNHDSDNDAQAFTSYFYGPDNGTYDTPRNYWFRVGDILFYNLDTEATYTYDPGFVGQIAHMKEVFAASDASYKVVLMHRSAYPMNYNEADVRALHADFEEMGVSLVLSGHDHIYHRTEMYGGEKAPGSGIAYIVGGCSSGSKFYDADSNGRPWQGVVYDENNPVFSVLKLRDGVLTIEAYALKNGVRTLVDEFTVLKRGDDAMLEAAKSIVEKAEGLGTLAQATADSAEKATEALTAAILALPGFSVTGAGVQVEIADFAEAVAGDMENYAGTDGSFTYTITLSLSGKTAALEPKVGAVTATAYVPVELSGGVSIVGEARYGETLTAVTTGLTPAGANLAYQWTRGNGGEIVGDESSFAVKAEDIGSILTLTVTGTKGYEGSFTAETGEIGKALRGMPERIGKTDVSEEGGTGALTGLDASMEYKAASDEGWTAVEGETVEGLAPGKYLVRYGETETQEPSGAIAVTILGYGAPPRNETPIAQFDAATMILLNVSEGMAYSLDGGATWTSAEGHEVTLSEEEVTTTYGIRVYAPGVEGESSDSEEQVIALTRAAAPAGVGRIGQTADASGAITGVDGAMEYKAKNDETWTAVNESADVVEVEPGVYLVRVAGSGTTLASQAVTVAVAAYVAPVATGVTLDKTSLNLYHNASPRTATLTAAVLPEGADQTVTWSSSDESVATVENGEVRAVGAGTATITATSADGGFAAQCSVQVSTYTSRDDSGSSNSGQKPTEPNVTVTPSGIRIQTTTASDGGVEVAVEVPAKAVENGKVLLPIESQSVVARDGKARLQISLPAAEGSIRVEIPVRGVTPGTVAVLVSADGTEEILKSTVTTENGLSVALSGTASVKIVDNTKSFNDVDSANWSAGAVNFVTSRELFNGTGADKFSPDMEMSRAMLMTVLYRFNGGKDSGNGGTWYESARTWAVAQGISDGTNPDGSITREQLAAILYRYAGSPTVNNGTAAFGDSGRISGFAQDAMAWAVSSGLITGRPGNLLAPQDGATRAEVSAILMRFAALYAN